jgi:hypothetical protein
VRKRVVPVILIAALMSLGVYASYAADEDTDTSQGWTPAQASAWTAAQMRYSQAIKEFGVNSPEATDAQVRMNTLARDLGIKAHAEPPEIAPIPPDEVVEAMELNTSTETLSAENIPSSPAPSAP